MVPKAEARLNKVANKKEHEHVDFLVFVTQEWLLVSILLALLFVYTWREKQRGGAPLSAHGVTQLLNRDEAILLDVRDTNDYKAGHIVDALNIPHNKLSERLAELNTHKNKIIVVADKLGQHAGHAGRLLREQGFEVRRLEGGMSEWQNQNLPVVAGKAAKGKEGKAKDKDKGKSKKG